MKDSYCFFADGQNYYWQMGFAQYMQSKKIFSEKALFTGYYGGLLTAFALSINYEIKKLCKMISKYNNKNKLENIQFIFSKEDQNMVEEIIFKLMEEKPNAYKLCNNKLVIPIQTINGSLQWVSEFISNKNLLDIIKASIFSSLLGVDFLKVNKKITLPVAPLTKFPLLTPYTIIITCRIR